MGVVKKENCALDNKSIRILNRIDKYLKDKRILNCEKLFENDSYVQKVRVASSKEILVSRTYAHLSIQYKELVVHYNIKFETIYLC
jgi:hypothetical protein